VRWRTDAASAIELSARRHLDGFVIDCDDVPGATDLLAEIRSSRSNKTSVVVAVVNGRTSVSTAVDAGANFVLGKPVLDKQLQSLLERQRFPGWNASTADIFATRLTCLSSFYATGETFAGKLINVSAGGLALTHFGPATVEGVVTVQFGLPSTEPQTFQAKAAVVWNDAAVMGLRFLRIEPTCLSSFETWLDSLEARLQFRESAQSSDAASKGI
jgi:CheY-like chemotaxis protein